MIAADILPAPRKINYGLAIAKAVMCFFVILCHFWYDTSNAALLPLMELRNIAVPVFSLISFWLMGRTFADATAHNARRRLHRLVWPHVMWAIIYWLAYVAMRQIGMFDFSTLFWQVLTGHSGALNPTMWFQTAMIIITALFFLLFRLLRREWALTAVLLLGAGAFWLQYSGLNYAAFGGLSYELRYPLGRTFEMLPYAALGVAMAQLGSYDRLSRRRVAGLIAACAVFALSYGRFIPSAGDDFGYSGFNKFLKAIGVVTFAYLLPLDRLPGAALKAIRMLTRYTLGIYCIHRLVERIMSWSGLTGLICQVLSISSDCMLMCAIIYAACYGVCALIALIPHRLAKQLVE